MRVANIPAHELTSELTLTVRITRVGVLRFRIWLGSQIIKLAARVIGCKSNIEVL